MNNSVQNYQTEKLCKKQLYSVNLVRIFIWNPGLVNNLVLPHRTRHNIFKVANNNLETIAFLFDVINVHLHFLKYKFVEINQVPAKSAS